MRQKRDWSEGQKRFDDRAALRFDGGVLLTTAVGERVFVVEGPGPSCL
jgi:hypothetical protein